MRINKSPLGIMSDIETLNRLLVEFNLKIVEFNKEQNLDNKWSLYRQMSEINNQADAGLNSLMQQIEHLDEQVTKNNSICLPLIDLLKLPNVPAHLLLREIKEILGYRQEFLLKKGLNDDSHDKLTD